MRPCQALYVTGMDTWRHAGRERTRRSATETSSQGQDRQEGWERPSAPLASWGPRLRRTQRGLVTCCLGVLAVRGETDGTRIVVGCTTVGSRTQSQLAKHTGTLVQRTGPGKGRKKAGKAKGPGHETLQATSSVRRPPPRAPWTLGTHPTDPPWEVETVLPTGRVG